MADGVWRLRLPLPWASVPHVNAWALEGRDGLVLVDCGLDAPGSLAELERALSALGAGLSDVRVLVCTHAHPDHYGQAARLVERAGCELWLHPRHAHATAALTDPRTAARLRRAAARRAGVPEAQLPPESDRPRESSGIAAVVEPDRELVDGVELVTAAGTWRAVETPGHAPSHVCLVAEGMLISGDHLLGRPALHFDFGFSPDPVGEYLSSLDRVESFGAGLCLPGHGPPFREVAGAIAAARDEVVRRLGEVEQVIRGRPTAFDVASRRHGARLHGPDGPLHLAETLALLIHLERFKRVHRERQDAVERWDMGSPN